MTEPEKRSDDTEITPEEKELLDNASGVIDPDDQRLRLARLDTVDMDGTALEEVSGATDLSGSDLDIPGSELDDENEAIGEEDEENNYYSESDTE
ncbi:MAG: hypothetical protein ACO25B_13015 [Chitinophagaceae bacterium]